MVRPELSAPVWRDAIVQATRTLEAAGVASPENDARVLAEYALNTASDDSDEQSLTHFESLIMRRVGREPLQHITGTMHFRFLDLHAAPGTFIVRPETEWLADEAIAEAQQLVMRAAGSTAFGITAPDGRALAGASQFGAEGVAPIAVDLCTGSGALALALATEVPDMEVWAVELSDAAFATARLNNEAYGNRVHLVRGDALTVLDGLKGRVDLVVSNPPYVPATDPIDAETSMEPALALWGGGDDGLDFPRALVARAAELLRPATKTRDGGLLVMEHAPSQAQALREAALAAGFAGARTGHDAAGRERWLVARRGEQVAASGAQIPSQSEVVPSGVQPAALSCTQPSAASLMLPVMHPHEYPAAISAACAAIRAGCLVVLPTDTVYGIGADAFSCDAVNRLLSAKGRGRDKPSPVLVASVAAAESLAHVDERARALMAAFWPGALTLVLPARENVGWDLGDTNGTVALRMPDHPAALALLEAAGPLAVSSANLTGEPPARTALQAEAMLGAKAACYLDAGDAPDGHPSTIVVLDREVRIVRSGGVADADILHVLAHLTHRDEADNTGTSTPDNGKTENGKR